MQPHFPLANISRRGLLAGAVFLAATRGTCAAGSPLGGLEALQPAPDEERSLSTWVDYDTRLRERLVNSESMGFDEDFSRALQQQVNGLRGSVGLAPYSWNDGLALCAKAHAADMAARNYFAHASPEGFTHLHRVALLTRDLCGKTAENLAWREFTNGTQPQDIEALWEGSPGHRRNLLRENFGSVGYGVVRVGDAVYAAGVYAEMSVRLTQPLPLWIKDEGALKTVLFGASPAIEHLALTPPFQQPTRVHTASGSLPQLQQGAWQLRPLRTRSNGLFDVVSGPLFFVG